MLSQLTQLLLHHHLFAPFPADRISFYCFHSYQILLGWQAQYQSQYHGVSDLFSFYEPRQLLLHCQGFVIGRLQLGAMLERRIRRPSCDD